MRVLQINVTGNLSTGNLACAINRQVEAVGGEGMVAYGRGTIAEDMNAYLIENRAGVFAHVLYTRLSDGAGFGSKKATQKLIEQINRFQPDIIHLHNIHGYYLNIDILLRFLAKYQRPIVMTLHDCWTFTGHCSHFENIKCDRWQGHCMNCPGLGIYPKSFGVDHSRENYERKKELFQNIPNLHIVTPSKWLKDLVGQSFLKNRPIQVIHNGIDVNAFYPKDNQKKSKKTVLGVASSWSREKGLYDFCKLAKLLPEEYRIVLVGISKKQSKKIPKEIKTIEKTQDKEALAKIYRGADVFVNLTYADTYPTVNIEALACGTPVVTYKTGGCAEMVELVDSIQAYKVVETGDLEGVVVAVKEVINIQPKVVVDKSTLDENSCVEQYVQLYEELRG